jgi:hypothetical protein
VIASKGHTRDGADDETWLDEAGRHGWIVLTKDKNIRFRPNELQALTAAGVGAFILSAAAMTGDEQAALFVRLLRRMSELTAATPRPFAFRIEKSGGIEPLTLRHAVDQRHEARRNR